ncbi:hypothetical protein BZA70DRAFT_284415 [Myxozyma melibiosi]|uniref:Pre-mRNA-splicing factor 18 n=1 Tax=Myxozyma melibiosi TaxID=54550 RepID=A0ABR1EZL4_9ASCO
MDFSAILAQEIAKKKAAAAAVAAGSAPSSSSSSSTTASTTASTSAAAPPKYLRRADLEALRAKQYREEQKKREEARRKEHEQRRKEREEEEERRERKRAEAEEKYFARKREREREEEEERERKKRAKSGKKGEGENKAESGGGGESKSSVEELLKCGEDAIVERLRKIGEPARLFDESEEARAKRLIRRERAIEKQQKASPEYRLADVAIEIEDEDLEDMDKISMQCEKYIRYLVKEWETVLVRREDTPEKAFETLDQTKNYLHPLLLQLEEKTLSSEILPRLATLLMFMQRKRYRDANDCYLKLSIGNAAWPIGVTAVGIHARSARERITGDGDSRKGLNKSLQVAHVMSDERTRKWLTSVKRLITFAESQWPE